jgi:hypothetical protein
MKSMSANQKEETKAVKTRTYVAVGNLRHDGKHYTAGAKIELTDDEVKALPKGTVKPFVESAK